MSVGCIIQARMGSTRLPGKVLKKIEDEITILDCVINQLSFSKYLEKNVVATTLLKEDDLIEKHLSTKKIECFRGDPVNVLERYFQCALQNSFSTIVRITADCPLIDPILIDDAIKKFQSGVFDYVTNAFPRTFPYGTEVEVFSFESLKLSFENAKKPSEKEHVTLYIKNHPEIFKIKNIFNKENNSHLRWTVDRVEDYELVKQIYKKIKNKPIFLNDILKLLEREPELIKINQNVIPNEGLKKSLLEDEKYLQAGEEIK